MENEFENLKAEFYKHLIRLPLEVSSSIIKTHRIDIGKLFKEGIELPIDTYQRYIRDSINVCGPYIECLRISAKDLLMTGSTVGRNEKKHEEYNVLKFFTDDGLLNMLGMLALPLGIINILQFVNYTFSLDHLTWYLVVVLIFCGLTYSVLKIKYKKQKRIFTERKQNKKLEIIQIFSEFQATNEIFKGIDSNKYPSYRIFVLENDKIEEDDKPSKKHNKSWWQLMMEKQKDINMNIARMPYDDAISANNYHKHSFKLFISPDGKLWMFKKKKEDDINKDICEVVDPDGQIHDTIVDLVNRSEVPIIINEKFIERSDEKIHNFTLCIKCVMNEPVSCFLKNCPGKNKKKV